MFFNCRVTTNEDMFCRLLVTSDPVISSLRQDGNNDNTVPRQAVLNLLIISDENNSSDDEDNSLFYILYIVQEIMCFFVLFNYVKIHKK